MPFTASNDVRLLIAYPRNSFAELGRNSVVSGWLTDHVACLSNEVLENNQRTSATKKIRQFCVFLSIHPDCVSHQASYDGGELCTVIVF